MIFPDSDKMNFRSFLLLLAFALCAETASALEYVRFLHDGKERNEEGRIFTATDGSLFEASDGFVLEARDGQVYAIAKNNLLARRSDEIPFEPYTKSEMLERLKNEFGEGYNYLDNYDSFIVVYTTSKPFATWYGNLLKKLHEQIVTHWKKHGVELVQPQFMLVAVVLSNEERFRQYAKQDGVSLLKQQCAYYHKWTNRIAMYDMSGQQVFQERDQSRVNALDMRRFLAQPGAYQNIMTVTHEAVHQIGFNTGMHVQFAPSPVWLYEGLAIFHEVPDLRNFNNMGWTLGPHVNHPRLDQLRQYWTMSHQEPPIQKMIKDDELFRKPVTALNHYALAWGLVYYLERRRPKELAAYLKILQEKTFDSDDSDEIRIADFESCFGNDWDKFYGDFAGFIRGLR